MTCASPFHWDAFDVYLFDIDGTLLRCDDAVHYFAFCDALTSIAQRPLNLDGVTAHGNTDIGILRDAFALAGVPEKHWRNRLPEIQERMCGFVEAHRSEFRVRALPLVRETLLCLRATGKLTGVATGNLARIGAEKLAAAGLLDLFHLVTWSDGCEARSKVFAKAAENARSVAGANCRIVLCGDTPADVRAARANGMHAVAVATGIYSFADLQREAPDLCIHSFEELATST